ncbi:MAG: hypothetical protein JXR70_06240 [Spirochaetales bacterium]|nr:hypothetical protein [Spirochaetales bacterium]
MKKILNKKGSRGYLLMDVIAAILISTVVLGTVLAGFSMVLRAAALTRDRVQLIITERNELEEASVYPKI